ncbi:MAG: hypothetical protein LBQ66_06075, partial [Planctomycetaceae bacterium]|nr:hypothetical protein [Planctomycetaceae bacterium]
MYWNFYWQKNLISVYQRVSHPFGTRASLAPTTSTFFGFGQFGISTRFPLPLSASTPTQPPGSRLPTLRLPTRLGVQFKLVRFYYAQRRAGRPRSSPSPL